MHKVAGSRLILLGSVVVAGVVHAWLASGRAGLAPTAATAFVVTFGLARISLVWALVPVLLTAYTAPALWFGAFGVSDYHTTLIWLAALAGPVLARGDRARWHIPSPWTWPFVAWGLVVALSWPIVAARELDFSLIAARTYDTTNAAFGGPPRVAAAWIVLVALIQMLAILWFDLLWSQFAQRLRTFERVVLVPLTISACIGALAGIYQVSIDPQWLNLWPGAIRAGGFMLDPNTFGIGTAMWGPTAIALAWRLGVPMWIGGATYALLGVAMWLAGSRTALLAFTLGSAGVLVALAQRRGIWQPRMAPIALLVSVAALVVAMAVAPRGGDSPSPLQRVFDRLPRPERAELKRFADEILWTRFGYGTAAAQMAAEHPLTGVGVGAFHVVALDYIYRNEHLRKEPDNAQNWWRHQIVELGFFGAFPVVWISLLLMAFLWRGGPYVEPLGVTTVLRTVLIGVGMASVLGVPTQHPASLLSFLTLFFWLVALGRPDTAPPVNVSRMGVAAAFALALVVAGGQFANAFGDLRVAERARRTELPYSYGLSAPEGLSEYGEMRWAATKAVAVARVPNRWLQLTILAPYADIETNPVTFGVMLNERRAIEHTIRDRAPVTFYLQMPEGARWTVLEIDASRQLQPNRALQVATTWLRELPASAPVERVVR